MLKIEFETLTHVEVADELYTNVIEPFYMSVECDKQTFCKLWLKMNATKVRQYREWQRDRWTLFDLHAAWIANKSLTSKMIQVANKWGVDIENPTRRINELDEQYSTIK